MTEAAASWWEVLILAAVQGLTEFLPISSSGHLVLVKTLLGVREGGVALEVILHLGTLLAVLLHFRRDFIEIAGGSLRFLGGDRSDRARKSGSMAIWVLIGTVPAVVGGLSIGDSIEAAFTDPRFVCFALLGTGVLLLSTLPRTHGNRTVTPVRAFLVGCFQCLALFPGVSRSGSTIAGGLHLGLRPEEAARFSFYLAVPIIVGAAIIKFDELAESFTGSGAPLYVLGLVVSFVFGYLSIGVLLRIVARGRFGLFGIYCLVVGSGGLLVLALR